MEAEDDRVLDGNLLSFISFRDSSARFSFAGQFTRTSDFSSLPTVRGRLKLYINFWRSLGTLQFIFNVISLGYKHTFLLSSYTFFSRQTMLRRFLTVCSCPMLLMNCSMLILLKRFFACLILSTRFQFPRVAAANKS